MIKPSMEEARGYCGDYQSIPISLELFSDIKTPIEVLKILKATGKMCYLLESVEGGEKWGRYSFLGFDPTLAVTCLDGEVVVKNGKTKDTLADDPRTVLREILADWKSPKLDFLPVFTGGFVGYIAYDFVKYTEANLVLTNENTENFDDLNLMLFDKVIAYDHLRQKIVVIVNIKTDNFEKNYIDGVIKLKEIEALIKNGSSTVPFRGQVTSEYRSLFTKDYYCEMVKKTREHIYQGDIFQAVISNRLEADFSGDLLSAYRVLRTINPSPYMFYIDFEGMQVAGASPETLVSLKNGQLSTFPIAGTCPRGATPAEDEALIAELLKDEKELSEHNMLVDLGRNDLGKVSEFGSVQVETYQEVVRYSHVSHISSTVTGTLKAGLDQLDALGAVLPAGTLSGAPKKRAIEIIDALEGQKRGVYGGAVGYIDFSGNMDMCIAIRMAVKKNDRVYVSAGAGIVADSIPEKEYNESQNKARAMFEALERAQEVE
ncbi:anthranilate synthase component I [Acetobacterium wieringae]|uniref:anthranilate synthase component I n=1 Tax=Acetobacterium wieringae TaxID=52694 RepID=UPI002033A8FF|nr:anthranilate synthase component I [Acetobacterium wieringae]URN82827.1 anthranilate synthase component I [Acetobacterium wieringae]